MPLTAPPELLRPWGGVEPAEESRLHCGSGTSGILISRQGSGKTFLPVGRFPPLHTAISKCHRTGLNSCRESWSERDARGHAVQLSKGMARVSAPRGPCGPGCLEAAAYSGPWPLWILAFREGRR